MLLTVCAVHIRDQGQPLATPPFVDFDYEARIDGFEFSDSQPSNDDDDDNPISLYFTVNITAVLSAGVIGASVSNNLGSHGFLSSAVLAGTVSWPDLRNASYSAKDCEYQEDLFASLWDLSSNGWLASPTTEVRRDRSHISYIYNCTQSTLPYCAGTLFGLGQIVSIDDGYLMLQTTLNGTLERLQWEIDDFANGTYVFLEEPRKRRNGSALPAVPKECKERPTACNATSSPLTLTLFKQHDSTFTRNVSWFNMNDLIGVASDLCSFPRPGALLSSYKITVDPAFTDYLYCFGTGCLGSAVFYENLGVGKINKYGNGITYQNLTKCDPSPLPVGPTYACSPQGGSCPVAGAAYSFTYLGRCPSGAKIGYEGCSWLEDYTIVKTIDLSCLQSTSTNGFKCTSDTLMYWAKQVQHAFSVCPQV